MSSSIQREFPLLKGKNIDALPEDLFIPPNALELILEEFSGPMDLLLYLINKKDIDILELNVASITEQYLQIYRDYGRIEGRACIRLHGHGGNFSAY